MNISNALLYNINRVYNKNVLEPAVNTWIIPFIKDNIALFEKKGASSIFIRDVNKKVVHKDSLVEYYAAIFIDEEIVNAFVKTLPKETQDVLKELVWMDFLSNVEIEQKYKVSVLAANVKIKEEFNLFAYKEEYNWYNRKYTYSFFLPKEVRKKLIEYLEKPVFYDFVSVEKLPKTDYIYNSEITLFEELQRLIVYTSQDNIKTTTNGKPGASTINKMRKALNLREFYKTKNKEFINIKSGLLAHFIVQGIDIGVTDVDTIKNLIKRYKYDHLSTARTLYYLKGTTRIHSTNHFNAEKVFIEILKEMPLNEWVSYENIIQYIQLRMLDINPISFYDAANYVYLGTSYDKKYATKPHYQKIIIEPLIKGTYFLFAALGLVDIAYDDIKDTSEIGETYFSPFDGLKYIRLTPLGAFVSKKTLTYEVPQIEQNDKLFFSKDVLMITANDENLTADVLLENYTNKVGTSRYVTDYSTFMKGCQTKSDLKTKIDLFKKTVATDLPENWIAFFEAMIEKTNPFIKTEPSYVFKISENPDLIRLIARDATLKQIVIKAEQFHIIVPKTKLVAFRKRLREFGYLMDLD